MPNPRRSKNCLRLDSNRRNKTAYGILSKLKGGSGLEIMRKVSGENDG
jgi:hypothetical protein